MTRRGRWNGGPAAVGTGTRPVDAAVSEPVEHPATRASTPMTAATNHRKPCPRVGIITPPPIIASIRKQHSARSRIAPGPGIDHIAQPHETRVNNAPLGSTGVVVFGLTPHQVNAVPAQASQPVAWPDVDVTGRPLADVLEGIRMLHTKRPVRVAIAVLATALLAATAACSASAQSGQAVAAAEAAPVATVAATPAFGDTALSPSEPVSITVAQGTIATLP